MTELKIAILERKKRAWSEFVTTLEWDPWAYKSVNGKINNKKPIENLKLNKIQNITDVLFTTKIIVDAESKERIGSCEEGAREDVSVVTEP